MLSFLPRSGLRRFRLLQKLSRFIHQPPLTLCDLQSDDLVTTKATKFKKKLPNSELKFGAEFTDHMLEIDWDNKTGWKTPQIVPYHSLSIDPACSALHYALQCFEGMKAYRNAKTDQIRLFRPIENMDRLNASCESLYFPTFKSEELLACIEELLRIERKWIPTEDGYSLYIRPTVISTYPYIGVAPATSVKLFTILSPVGPYFPSGFSAIKLYADENNVRAWPGGAGSKKIGSNYGPTIRPQMEASKRGYSQILWLFGKDQNITEVGTMNQFFFWIRPDGKKELITAPLDGTILPGVTRKSVLEICRKWGEFEVAERNYTIHEVIDAIKDGRLIESFGSGTAAVVAPVSGFHFRGSDYDIPLNPDKPDEQSGPLSRRLWETLVGIQSGSIPHEWSKLVD